MNTILRAFHNGSFVAIIDAPTREHEADLMIAAEHITVPRMAFLLRYTSGIITIPMTRKRLRELGLRKIHTTNPARFATPFTISVDVKQRGMRGGVSARERVATIRALVNPRTRPHDLGRPGHIFPLAAHPRGLAGRCGHTEAAIALCERTQCQPIAVIGELMNDDGTMMRGNTLVRFLTQHHIPWCTIAELLKQ